jgi:DNA polymerase-3 subunit beta
MKTVNRREFLSTLRTVAKACDFTCRDFDYTSIRLSFSDEHISVSARDVGLVVSSRIKCDGKLTVEDPVIPAKDLIRIIASLPYHEVQISPGADGTVRFASGTAHIDVAVGKTEPPTPRESKTLWRSRMPHSAFKSLLDSVAFAMGTDVHRYYLSGVLIEATEDKILAVATNGHQLALKEFSLPQGAATGTARAVIPKRTVQMLRSIKPAKSDMSPSWLVHLSEKHAEFVMGDYIVESIYIDTDYVPWQRVIPDASSPNMKWMRFQYRDMLPQAKSLRGIVQRDNDMNAMMLCSDGVNTIGIERKNMGSVARAVIHGEASDISAVLVMNAAYFTEAIENLPGGQIEVGYTDAFSPILFRQAEDQTGFVVVMPMRGTTTSWRPEPLGYSNG